MAKPSIIITHPKIVTEWDYDNNTTSPEYYTYGSRYKAAWICSQCGHKWSAEIRNRICHGSGCPKCHPRGPKREYQNSVFRIYDTTTINSLTPTGEGCYIRDVNNHSRQLWQFKCVCGRTVWYIKNQVLYGHIKSCGKCKQPTIGMKIGQLTVIRLYKKHYSGRYLTFCECQCDCGKTWNGPANSLLNNHTRSCGCNSNTSLGNKRIRSVLTSLNVDYDAEKIFYGCYGKKKRPLRFDFFIPSQRLCIEYQGQQHYSQKYFDKLKKIYNIKDTFQNMKERDEIKRQYCITNNIRLLEIPYTKYDNVEEIIKRELKMVDNN